MSAKWFQHRMAQGKVKSFNLQDYLTKLLLPFIIIRTYVHTQRNAFKMHLAVIIGVHVMHQAI